MVKKVEIGGHTFTVKHREMDDLCGKVERPELTIYIDNTKPESIQQETLLHEILHCIKWLAGTERKDDEKDERDVQAESHLLFQVLKSNKLW